MDPRQAPRSVQFKVGIFSLLALALLAFATFMVNDKPDWWRGCDLVFINVEDATGLKTKSPVRSLGLQVGYLRSVQLRENRVRLGICLTADVEVISTTRAYLRGEGFLGDKFVELKPLKYVGRKLDDLDEGNSGTQSAPASSEAEKQSGYRIEGDEPQSGGEGERLNQELNEGFKIKRLPARHSSIWDWLVPSAAAQEKKAKEVQVGAESQDVQALVNQVNGLVSEMTNLTKGLKDSINPQELRNTMQQLNRTLENASRTLAPEGSLTSTAQRTLAKLEDAIEQLRDLAIRINRGEGSVGMILTDPFYAEQVKELLKNANQMLSRVGGVRFIVDVGAQSLPAYDGTRGTFQISIWPKPDRYYRLGAGVDPRGFRRNFTTTTVSGGTTTTVQTTTVEDTALVITAMLGKIFFKRLDLSMGALYGDGVAAAALRLGPSGREDRLEVFTNLYSRGRATGISSRVGAILRPYEAVYLTGGFETFRRVNGQMAYFVGAGVAFDDEDVKLLFALL
jgi:phospholipid/cholesterol/gamma-HCH transport system substrate-binding protein